MTISGSEMLFYTLAFLVPGFIMNFAYSMFVPQKTDLGQASMLRYLYFSCINYALWSWLFYIIIKTNYADMHPFKTAVLWGIVILISPFMIGMIVGILTNRNVFRDGLSKIGITSLHVIPTAWDYKFSTTEARWTIVTLKDGSIVAGIFGSSSFSSSDYGQRDLYLERVYRISDSGNWIPAERSDGVLIMGEQIKHIEFKF